MTTFPPPEQPLPDAYTLAEELAKVRSIRFATWRTITSIDLAKRHLLSLPLSEQYDQFMLEDKADDLIKQQKENKP